MKIKIPYVVVTAVKGREVNDVVFIDTASRKTCAGVFIDIPAESAGDSND